MTCNGQHPRMRHMATALRGFNSQPRESYDPAEQDDVLREFARMLRAATADGGRKRAAGTKPPWYVDKSHEGAMFRHIAAWKSGELMDKDSGAHPLVHAAWRALAIAFQESDD